MTCTVHKFPASAAFTEAMKSAARREAIVIAARTILRSAARHSDADLHEACLALQTWGNCNDYLEADAMLLAMRLRARRRAHEAEMVRAQETTVQLAMRHKDRWPVIVAGGLVGALVLLSISGWLG